MNRDIHFPAQPAELGEADTQEHEGDAEPQTAALPGGSHAADVPEQRFVPAALDSAIEAEQLHRTEQREHATGRHQREPIRKGKHGEKLLQKKPERSRMLTT